MTRFPILLLTLALVGCADVDKLQQENQRLRAEMMLAQARLAAQAGEKAADHAYFDRQASIAAACDWIVPVCPSSLTATGHEAQAGGYGGGGWEFWLIVLFKFALLGATVGTTITTSKVVWLLIGKPAADAIDRAKQLVSHAQGLADEATRRAITANAQAKATEKAVAATEAKLAELDEELHYLNQSVAGARDEQARMQATMVEDARVRDEAAAVLSVFNKKPK